MSKSKRACRKQDQLVRLSDYLPRPMKVMKRCDGITGDGMRCKSFATVETYVFLDSETHGHDCTAWVRVRLCNECCPKNQMRKANKNYLDRSLRGPYPLSPHFDVYRERAGVPTPEGDYKRAPRWRKKSTTKGK